MSASNRPSHVGQAIVDSLIAHEVSRVFVVPGESYLAVLDGLCDTNIETIIARHEGGAAYMAEAYGRLTGSPGVAMVTRGPGAANAFVAVHAAWQDGTPLVIFVGLIPIADRQREAFQEFDPNAWFGTQTKRVFTVDDPARASEIVAEAFFAAVSGRPGPVVVGLPEDIISEQYSGAIQTPYSVAEGSLSTEDIEALTLLLRDSQRPLLFLGGERWTSDSAAAVQHFAERNKIPLLHDWRAADRVPASSPANAGWLGYGRDTYAATMFETADLVIAIGQPTTDVATDGYKLRQQDHQQTVLITIDSTLRGHSGSRTSHFLATPVAFAKAIEGLDLGRSETWHAWMERGHNAFLATRVIPDPSTLQTRPGTARMSTVTIEVLARINDDAITCFGAGNHCLWAQRYFPTEVYPSQLGMRNGSMGYSVPAAVAASLEMPKRQAIAICGDGEFLMNGQELATAVQYGATPLVIVVDNAQYGTIRAHQELQYPGRVIGTQLKNPDFAALMTAYGGHGEFIDDDTQVATAVERAFLALDEGKPALLHVLTDQSLDLK